MATVGSRIGKAVSRAAVASLSSTNGMKLSRRGVVLTGNTLEASLKMRCDTSGAGYAIYWTKVGDRFVVAGDHVTPARKAALKAQGKTSSYAEASWVVQLKADGDGPVASCYRTGSPIFYQNAAEAGKTMVRKALLANYGIASVCFIKFEDGVLEYGTSNGPCTADWAEMPVCPTMPKAVMRRALENHGGKYLAFWSESNGAFSIAADYVTAERLKALKAQRGDDKTFVSESRAYKLPADGDGPVATAARTGEEQYFAHAPTEPSFRRAELAREFGVEGIHFVPVEGGVMEYGIPKDAKLSGNLLKAALKMRCDTSGAGYSIYWTEENGKFVVAGDYVTPARRAALLRSGETGSFAEGSQKFKLDAAGHGPVATVGKTGKPFYIPNAQECAEMKRGDLAKQFGIASIALIPVEGGVLEYGTSTGPCTADWGSEMPKCPDMPKEEMRNGLRKGAAGFIFWKKEGDHFVAAADYVTPERVRAARATRSDDKTFASESRGVKLLASGDGYVATAARSGKEMICLDAKTDLKLVRQELAKEFNVGEVHFVPCKDGVLEYGIAPMLH